CTEVLVAYLLPTRGSSDLGARYVHVPHLVRTRRVRLRHRDRLRHAVPGARRDARAVVRLGLRTEAAMRPRRGAAIARHVVLILGDRKSTRLNSSHVKNSYA